MLFPTRSRSKPYENFLIRPLPDRPHNVPPLSHAIAPPPRPDGFMRLKPQSGDGPRAVETEPPRAAPIALWRAARWFLCTLHALFGAPADVARQHTFVSYAPRPSCLNGWRCAEAMLRRLLLIKRGPCPNPTRARCFTRRANACAAPSIFVARQAARLARQLPRACASYASTSSA